MRNADVIRRVLALFEAGRNDEALALYHPDVVVEAWGSVLGGRYVGHAGLGRFQQRVAAAIPGRPRFELVRLIDCEDAVVAEFAGETTLPAGGTVRWRTVEVFDMRDGLVAGVRLYTDTEALASMTAGAGSANRTEEEQ